MANRIKGITVEIGGDTTKLTNALKGVNSEIRNTQSQLKDVEKLLKLDPGNTELLTQKHKLLGQAVSETKDKLATLKTAAEQANTALANGDISQEQYDALQREIIETEQALERLEQQAGESAVALQKIAQTGEKLQSVGSAVENIGKKMSVVSAGITAVGTASAKMAVDFEDAMAKVSTIADTSEVPLDELEQSILDLSNQTGISSTEIAQNVYDAISAGQKTGDAVNFVSNSTRLAKAGFADAGAALDVLTTIMNAYGLEADKVTEVSDMLIQTQNLGKTTVGELSSSMGKIIPTANAYGVQLDQLCAGYAITKDNGEREIVKQECYVFDFALDRALCQISDYSCRLNVAESNPEKKVAEFINFLPVLAYDGSAMRQVNAAAILDIAMAGTSATLLAKRWESALLVNVDNDTLARLLASEEAMDALMRIEGFRSLNADIETIINKSNAVKKAKRDGEKLTPKEKKELTDAEKENKSKRKMIQEKLIKFATRVPVFMYLTDYREFSLQDVITQLEPELFKKVTGLDVKDFELLVSLNVFNEALMNDAVYKFKRYEDASLIYTGIDKHTGENVGLYSTVISRADYDAMAGQFAASMTADAPRDDDIPDRPVFVNISDDDEDEDDLPMVAAPKAKREATKVSTENGKKTGIPKSVSREAIDRTSFAVCKTLYYGYSEEIYSKRDIAHHLGIAQKHVDKFLMEVSRWNN